MDIKIILDHLTIRKTNWNDLKKEEKEGYNPYLINLWLSHVPSYIEIINEVQTQQVPNRDHYKFWLEVLPKKKLWLQWLKPKSKPYSKELILYLSEFYKVSTKEMENCFNLLDDENIVHILENIGLGCKEIKKILHG